MVVQYFDPKFKIVDDGNPVFITNYYHYYIIPLADAVTALEFRQLQ